MEVPSILLSNHSARPLSGTDGYRRLPFCGLCKSCICQGRWGLRDLGSPFSTVALQARAQPIPPSSAGCRGDLAVGAATPSPWPYSHAIGCRGLLVHAESEQARWFYKHLLLYSRTSAANWGVEASLTPPDCCRDSPPNSARCLRRHRSGSASRGNLHRQALGVADRSRGRDRSQKLHLGCAGSF